MASSKSRKVGSRSKALSEAKAVKQKVGWHAVLCELLLDHGEDLVIVLDANHHRLYCNAAAERFLVHPNGRDAALDIHPEDRDRVIAQFREVIETGLPQCSEFRVVLPRGVFFLESEARPIRDAETGEIRVVSISRDITKRKEDEASLLRSEERYALAVRGTHDGLWDWNVLTNETYASPRLRELLGLAENEFPPRIDSFFNRLHPDEIPSVKEALRRHLEEGAPYNLQHRLRHRDGTYRWFQCRGEAQRDGDGRPVRMAGFLADVSERRLLEERVQFWERVFLGSEFGLAYDDVETHNFIDLNDAFARQRGYTRQDLIGQSLLSITVPEEHETLTRRLDEVVRMGNMTFESLHVRKDGSRLPVFVELSVMRDAAGTPKTRVVHAIDISARKRAEAQRDTLARRLIAVQEKERRAIARDLHDHVGQELSLLKTTLMSLVPKAPNDQQLLVLEGIRSADRLLEDVRELALTLRPSLLDDLGLEAAMESYAERFALRAGFSVECYLDPGAGVPAEIAIACFRVFQEALTNVLRHAKASRVVVSLRRLGNSIDLRVKDDGIGFDPAGVRRAGEASTGFGLMSMQERALMAEGEIHVTSAPGQGTEIHATFSDSSGNATTP